MKAIYIIRYQRKTHGITLPEWSDAYTQTKEYIDQDGRRAFIPKGFRLCLKEGENKVSDGLVVKDANENEFVWIPVKDMTYEYDRYAFSDSSWTYEQEKGELDSATNSYKIVTKSNANYVFVEEMPNDEKASIDQYGGYYIGRYESGIEGDTERTSSDNGNINTAMVVKKDKIVYNYISQEESKQKAESFYNKETDGVISRLCSSYAWDTALKFIDSEAENKGWITKSTGGNYNTASGGTGELKKTGYHSVNNIYDMGGNIYEWTTENQYGSTTNMANRGGYYKSGIASSAALRNYNSKTYRAVGNGFRIAVFIAE